MLRLLTIVAIVSIASFAKTEDGIKNFFTQQVKRNPNITLVDIAVKGSKPIKGVSGWDAYFVKIKLLPKNMPNPQEIVINEIAFSNGKVIAPDLNAIKDGMSYKRMVHPDVSPKLYNSKFLEYGEEKASNKILIFSDPRCPFCLDLVPDIMKIVKEHPTLFALYYYNYPLESIHPRSKTLTQATHIAKNQGFQEVELKVYQHDFDSIKADPGSVLKEFNKMMGTKITLKALKSKEVIDAYKHEIGLGDEMMIRGTPSVFINGKKSQNPRAEMEKIIEESKK
jgi:protein-disulfide isomerase